MITNNTFEPESLQRWQSAPNYMGPDFSEYFVVYARFPAADDLAADSNFISLACILAGVQDWQYQYTDIQGIGPLPDGLLLLRQGHWAYNELQILLIHESEHDLLAKADDLIAGLQDYPLVSDEHYSFYQDAVLHETWERLTSAERLEHVKEHKNYIDAGSWLDLYHAIKHGDTYPLNEPFLIY